MQRAPRTVLSESLVAEALLRDGIGLCSFGSVVTCDDIGTTNWHPQHRELRHALLALLGPSRVWLLNDRFGPRRFEGAEAWQRQALQAYGLRPERLPKANYLIPAAAVLAAEGRPS
jgi:hypothetical protein